MNNTVEEVEEVGAEHLPEVEKETPERQYVVERILDKKGSGCCKKYLVQWAGYPGEDSWESAAKLSSSCPYAVQDFEEQYQAKKLLEKERAEGAKKLRKTTNNYIQARKPAARKRLQVQRKSTKKTSTTTPNISSEVEQLFAKLHESIRTSLPANKIPHRMLTAETRTTAASTSTNSSSSSSSNNNFIYAIEWKNMLHHADANNNNDNNSSGTGTGVDEHEDEFSVELIDGKCFKAAYPQMLNSNSKESIYRRILSSADANGVIFPVCRIESKP